MTNCAAKACNREAQPEHSPCCSSSFHQGRSLCCEHYCRFHFVEAHPCSPETHCPCLPGAPEHRHGVGGYATTTQESA